MNYVPHLSTRHCLACETEHYPQQLSHQGLCEACAEDAAAEVAAERAAEFRDLAHDYLTRELRTMTLAECFAAAGISKVRTMTLADFLDAAELCRAS